MKMDNENKEKCHKNNLKTRESVRVLTHDWIKFAMKNY